MAGTRRSFSSLKSSLVSPCVSSQAHGKRSKAVAASSSADGTPCIPPAETLGPGKESGCESRSSDLLLTGASKSSDGSDATVPEKSRVFKWMASLCLRRP